MKRFMLILFVMGFSFAFGQHFKLSHATMRNWSSQSNKNQRGVEYRVTFQSLKKIKNMTLARAWVYDKCFVIESITINNRSYSSSNQTIAKGATVKIFLNIKEEKDVSGSWILNNNECNGTIPLTPNEGIIRFEYSVNGTPCSLIIKNIEPLERIEFE